MKEIKLIKRIATLNGKFGLTYAELNEVRKFDIREWNGDKYSNTGIRFTDVEINELDKLLSKITDYDTSEDKSFGMVGNKEFCIENGSFAFVIEANLRRNAFNMSADNIKALQNVFTNARNQMANPLKSMAECLMKYDVDKAFKKATEKKKTSTKKSTEKKTTTKNKPKAKVVQFPKDRVVVEPIATEGSATYEECESKLNKEREMFKDQDSAYVIDGLLELCKVDDNFRNRVMLKEKTYAGSFEYFADKAKSGYAIKYGNTAYLDNDMALGLAIDYFNEPVKEAK